MSTIIIKNLSADLEIPETARKQLEGVEVALCTPPGIMFIGQPTVGTARALKAYEDLQFEFGYMVSREALLHVSQVNKLLAVTKWLQSLNIEIFCFGKNGCEYCS